MYANIVVVVLVVMFLASNPQSGPSALYGVNCDSIKSDTPILQNHDLMKMAQTGTGKTAAFVLPSYPWFSAGKVEMFTEAYWMGEINN